MFKKFNYVTVVRRLNNTVQMKEEVKYFTYYIEILIRVMSKKQNFASKYSNPISNN